MKKDLLKGLTDEQIAKVKACKNQEEVLKLAKEEGIELSDEQLAAVSGGGCFSTAKCGKCGGELEEYWLPGRETVKVKCKKCGNVFYKRIETN